MAQIAIPLAIASTVMSASNSLASGKAQARALEFQAQQAEQNAIAEQATSQRQAISERRKANLLQSRAQAVAAASGAGASDVTVNELMGDIGAEGDYNVLSALFEGDTRASGQRMYADARRFEAKEAKRYARSQAISTIMNGASSIGGSFGGGGTQLPSAPMASGTADPNLPWLRQSSSYDRNLPWLR